MASLRSITLAAALLTAFAAFAQTAAEHAAHHPAGAASSASSAATSPRTDGMGAMGRPTAMARMDAHMKAMQGMHDKMAAARTPEERQALMAEHMKLMQEGMAMMGGMGHGVDAMPGGTAKPGAAMSPQMRQQMMEKRMDMMQSMMQMMMDRMQAPAPAPK